MRFLKTLLFLCLFVNVSRADESDAHYKTCNALKQQGKLQEAVGECQTALQLRETAAAHFTMANLQRQLGNGEESISHLEAAAKMASSSAPIHANLGAAYLRASRTDDG